MKAFILKTISNTIRQLRGELSFKQYVKRGLKIGNNVTKQGGVRIDTSYCFLIEMGNNVGLSTDVTILAHDNSTARFTGYMKIGRVTIGNNVIVGAKSLILPNTKIGDNVIIGAGSVVNKDIPSNSVYAGNPARYVCSIDEFIAKTKSRMINRPIFDNSYNALKLTNHQKEEMKKKLTDGFGYYISQIYGHLINETKDEQ